MLEADTLGPRSTIIVRSGHQPRYLAKRPADYPICVPATTLQVYPNWITLASNLWRVPGTVDSFANQPRCCVRHVRTAAV